MKNKIFLFFSFIIFFIFFISSCTPNNLVEKVLNKVDTAESDMYLLESFDSICNNDYEAFSEVFDYPITKESFHELIISLNGGIDGSLVGYQLGGYFINKSNNTTTYTYNYNLQTTNSDYVFQILLVSKNSSIRKFQGLKVFSGQLEDAQPKIVGKSPIQIGILIYSAFCIALIVFTIVKCIKSKVRLKVLWILGMLFQVGISFGKSQSIVNFGLKIHIGISTYSIGSNGDFYIVLLFPLLALIFLAVKVRAEKRQSNLQEYVKEYEVEKQRALELSNEDNINTEDKALEKQLPIDNQSTNDINDNTDGYKPT